MKKLIASLLVLVFGATMVMAEVPAVAVNSEQVVASEAAFAEVEGTPLGKAESADVKGGQLPDLDGSVIYGSGAKPQVMNSDSIPTKKQFEETKKGVAKIAKATFDVGCAVASIALVRAPSTGASRTVGYLLGGYALGTSLRQCSRL
ncbi:MAG: hypothetical protein ACOZCE_11795 [Spirochaetota bacterium]